MIQWLDQVILLPQCNLGQLGLCEQNLGTQLSYALEGCIESSEVFVCQMQTPIDCRILHELVGNLFLVLLPFFPRPAKI